MDSTPVIVETRSDDQRNEAAGLLGVGEADIPAVTAVSHLAVGRQARGRFVSAVGGVV
jgi:hypothetical protein